MLCGDLFLFESAYSAEIFRHKIGTPKGLVRIVHNGVTRAEFAPIATAPDATDLVFIGELRPVKGVDILIDALAELRRQGRTVTATLVGDGPDRAALQAQVERLGLAEVVHFAGAMPARQAQRLGRIMVIPSRAESLPYVVLETVAAGMPLITTNVGGIPEIYGPRSDCLVAPHDPGALAARHRASARPSRYTPPHWWRTCASGLRNLFPSTAWSKACSRPIETGSRTCIGRDGVKRYLRCSLRLS